MPSGVPFVRDSPGGVHRQADVLSRRVGHVDTDQPFRHVRVVEDEAL